MLSVATGHLRHLHTKTGRKEQTSGLSHPEAGRSGVGANEEGPEQGNFNNPMTDNFLDNTDNIL